MGRLLAAVGSLTMPDRIVVTSTGVVLVERNRAAVDAGIAADRDPRASGLDVVTRPGDFRQWQRGAGVVATQDFVLRANADLGASRAPPRTTEGPAGPRPDRPLVPIRLR